MEAGEGQGRVTRHGDGGLREAQPPLDKLELQTVETCEIRMEPSLLRCDLEDRGTQRLAVHSAASQTSPLILTPLCCSALLFFGQI